MTVGSIPRRYAKAIYDLAVEEQSVEATGKLLRELGDGIETAGRASVAEGVLELPARRAVGEALASKFGRDSLSGRFIRLVAERDRLADLPLISEWYAKLEDEAAGRVRIGITTPAALSGSEVDAIRKAFRSIAGGEVVAHVNTDPGLLGGAIVELQGRVFDGSVRTALARLAARMAGTI